MNSLREIKQCRVCSSSNLKDILSLGSIAVSDFVDAGADGGRYPLNLILCDASANGCGLLQLCHTVSAESMYKTYWYRSGMNATMTKELESIASRVTRLASLRSGDTVIDIGANDGTLLRGYAVDGLTTVGYEPAHNLAKYNSDGTSVIIQDFFNAAAWRERFPGKKAKAITAIAMFYDLDDPNSFVSDIAECLDQSGVFVIQMSYLPLMLSENAFDNICHEHLEYYGLRTLENLLNRHNLEVFDVELNDVNGGSYRVYIRHRGKESVMPGPIGADIRVESLRLYEDKLELSKPETYHAFARRVEDIKKKVTACIRDAHAKGKTVYVYGASTKGNTLLQYFGLDHTLITAAAERNSDKWGKFTVATNIPIISEEQARKDKPDYFLVLPWHFLDEFVKREHDYFIAGGKFIVPLPEFKIVGA